MTRLLPLLLLLSMTATAQIIPTLEPGFLRPGVYYSPKQYPVYAHAWAGAIAPRFKLYAWNVKAGIGFAIPSRHNTFEMSAKWLIGVNAQHFWQVRDADWLDLSKIHRISIEAGICLESRRVTVVAITDPPFIGNFETCIGVVIRGKSKCYTPSSIRKRQVPCSVKR